MTKYPIIFLPTQMIEDEICLAKQPLFLIDDMASVYWSLTIIPPKHPVDLAQEFGGKV